MSDTQATIYSTPTCHFCQLAKEFFEEHGITYTDHNVAEDMDKRKEMIEKSGQMGVPVIVVGGETLVGFDKDKLSAALGIAE